MELGGVDRDAEAARDELVRGALGQQQQDLGFARGQRLVEVGDGVALGADQAGVGALAGGGEAAGACAPILIRTPVKEAADG
jgi:hypothetical protein